MVLHVWSDKRFFDRSYILCEEEEILYVQVAIYIGLCDGGE